MACLRRASRSREAELGPRPRLCRTRSLPVRRGVWPGRAGRRPPEAERCPSPRAPLPPRRSAGRAPRGRPSRPADPRACPARSAPLDPRPNRSPSRLSPAGLPRPRAPSPRPARAPSPRPTPDTRAESDERVEPPLRGEEARDCEPGSSRLRRWPSFPAPPLPAAPRPLGLRPRRFLGSSLTGATLSPPAHRSGLDGAGIKNLDGHTRPNGAAEGPAGNH